MQSNQFFQDINFGIFYSRVKLQSSRGYDVILCMALTMKFWQQKALYQNFHKWQNHLSKFMLFNGALSSSPKNGVFFSSIVCSDIQKRRERQVFLPFGKTQDLPFKLVCFAFLACLYKYKKPEASKNKNHEAIHKICRGSLLE